MPTANEIEAYGGDRNLAFGSSALPAFSNAEVVDFSPAVKYWSDYAQNKLQVAREQDAQLKAKQLQAQQDLQKQLDAGNYKIWDADQKEFIKKYNQFRELAIDVAKRGAWQDVNDEDYLKAMKMQQDLEQFAQFSNQQMEHYKVGIDEYTKNTKEYRGNTLAPYKNVGDPFKRKDMEYSLDPKIGFDLTKYYPLVLKRLQEENSTLTAGVTDRNGYTPYTHEGELKIDGAIKMADGAWESDPDAQELGQYMYQADPTNFSSPKDAFTKFFVEKTVPESLAGEIKARLYSPYERAGATQVTVPYEKLVPFNFKEAKSGKTQTGYLIDAYDIAKVAGAPANINVVPTQANDLSTGQPLTKDQIGTAVWKTDGLKVGTAFKNKAGGYTVPNSEAAAQDLIDKGYPQEKVAIINAAIQNPEGGYLADRTVIIPYSDIATQLEISKVKFEPATETRKANPKEQPKATVKKKGDRLQIGDALFTISEVKEVNGATYYKTERGWVDASKL